MEKTLDCRGMDCPAPVLKTKVTIEKERPEILEILVDNEAARQNVVRFLESQGYQATVTETERDFIITGTKGEISDAREILCEKKASAEKQKIMIMVATDTFGKGSEELGEKLMGNFIKTLKEMGDELWRLVFVNSGVKLTINGRDTVSDLKALEDRGIHILVCGTCLTYFELLDKKAVGETTNMLDIVTAMQLADKVINI
jgi:selenium metabolism protein YedF